jgi:DNA-binding NtrC family response regulator
MTDTLTFNLPFVESGAVAKERQTAFRLAATNLPILIAGERGTGRRTLANQICKIRSNNGRVPFQVHAIDGLPVALRETFHQKPPTAVPVVVFDVELLSPIDQQWVATNIKERSVLLVATTGIGDKTELAPELNLALIATKIVLPSLRNRSADVLSWARLFLHKASGQSFVRVGFSNDAETAIASYSWPGNLTELETRIERACALCENGLIRKEELGLSEAGDNPALLSLDEALDRFKRKYIQETLDRFGGNRTRTANALRVDPRTIFRYLENKKTGVGED